MLHVSCSFLCSFRNTHKHFSEKEKKRHFSARGSHGGIPGPCHKPASAEARRASSLESCGREPFFSGFVSSRRLNLGPAVSSCLGWGMEKPPLSLGGCSSFCCCFFGGGRGEETKQHVSPKKTRALRMKWGGEKQPLPVRQGDGSMGVLEVGLQQESFPKNNTYHPWV